MIWSLIRLCIRVLPQPPQLATCPPLSRVGVKILFFARDGRLDGQSHRALRDDISLDLLGGDDAVDENRSKTDGAENETRDAPDFNDQSDIENRNPQHGIQP